MTNIMPTHTCPFTDCNYEMDDVTDQLAATLLSIHASGAHTASTAVPVATSKPLVQVQNVCHPIISTVGSSDECSYLRTHWSNYVEGTKITGKDQLLESSNEELHKDLALSIGGSLSNKLEADVPAAMMTLAVHGENTMVADASLYEIGQD